MSGDTGRTDLKSLASYIIGGILFSCVIRVFVLRLDLVHQMVQLTKMYYTSPESLIHSLFLASFYLHSFALLRVQSHKQNGSFAKDSMIIVRISMPFEVN